MDAADGREPLLWPTYRIPGVTARLEELTINRRLAHLHLHLHLHLPQGSIEALESVADLEPAKISDLTVLTSVSKQSLCKVLRRRESLGLLSKERGSDSRSTSVTLTLRGRKILVAAEKLLDAMEQPGAGYDAALRHSVQPHLNDLRKNQATQLPPEDAVASRTAGPKARVLPTGGRPSTACGVNSGPGMSSWGSWCWASEATRLAGCFGSIGAVTILGVPFERAGSASIT